MTDKEVAEWLMAIKEKYIHGGDEQFDSCRKEALDIAASRMMGKGHWEMNSDHPDRLICSECNSQFDVWHWESKQMHFCPNCGADMRKEGEQE